MIAVAPTYSSLASRSIIAAPLAQFTVDWILILAQRSICANKRPPEGDPTGPLQLPLAPMRLFAVGEHALDVPV